MGYDFVRIDRIEGNQANKILKISQSAYQSSKQQIRNDDQTNRPDAYHYPDKRDRPEREYQYAYDIYSLGMVLVEIGLWKPLSQIIPKL
jgi:hypothetical protein